LTGVALVSFPLMGSDRVTVALCIVVMLVACVWLWRGRDVRVTLLAAAMAMGCIAGQPGVVFRRTAEALTDAKYVLPICSAMGFAHALRETGCIDALVEVLVRPIARVSKLLLPGGSAVALVVNAAIPSQTSTLASTGPLVVALMARLGTSAVSAGVSLVFGASVAGSLLNPGLAEITAVASMTKTAAPVLVVSLLVPVLAAFAAGTVAATIARRFGVDRTDALLKVAPAEVAAETAGAGADRALRPRAYRALLPPLPVALLLLAHPSLPTHRILARVVPEGLEVFTSMVAGSALAIAFAARERQRVMKSLLDGMGYAFAHIVTIIAVSSGVAKGLEIAGVLRAFVALVSGYPLAALAATFALTFALAVVSGSGTAPCIALVATLSPRAAELGVSPLALGGVILFAAEAGRTTSPVAAVLHFGAALVSVPPRALCWRLALPCLTAGAVGAATSAALWR
jgi:DcuC family C4-dicarboxylate transporter